MAYQSKTIYPSGDVSHGVIAQASWEDARDATDSGTIYTGSLVPVVSWRTSGRSSTTFTNIRNYMQFDIGSIPYGSAIMSAIIYLWFDNSDGDMRLVSHTQSGTITQTTTYNDCLYSGRSGDVMIPYADEFEDLESIPAAHTPIALNGTAIDNIKNVTGTLGSYEGIFRIALVTEKDFDDTAPSDTTSDDSDVYTHTYAGTSRDPKLVIQYENPSIFMGANF